MSAVRKFPKFFCSGITIVKAQSEFFRHNGVFSVNGYSDFAVVIA